MDTFGIVVALLTLVLGAVIGYLLARLRSSAALAEQAEAHAAARAEHDRTSAEARAAQDRAAAEARAAQDKATAEARAELARATAERDAAMRLADELKADRAAMADQFALLSQRSLDAQTAKLDKTAEHRMDATQQLVEPLAESLRSLTQRLGEVETERARLAAELSQQVRQVRDSGESIRREALGLATALRTPQVRGAWGEQSLRRIAEVSGLKAHCDFDDQQTYTASDGGRFRPDMRVNLPDSRVVFVDSKVPLAAILDAYNTDDEAAQRTHIGRFAKHVRTHIDQLGAKGYWQLDQRSPDFVVLFLGSDEFLRLALESVPDLHDYAAKHDVILASPGLLIPLLRTISHGWRQSELAESASEVIRLGRELFDRLVTMGGHVDKLGRALSTSVRAYNGAVSSLESRVMVSARRFNELRVTDAELKTITPIDEPLRDLAVPEMLAWEEERASVAELASRRGTEQSAG